MCVQALLSYRLVRSLFDLSDDACDGLLGSASRVDPALRLYVIAGHGIVVSAVDWGSLRGVLGGGLLQIHRLAGACPITSPSSSNNRNNIEKRVRCSPTAAGEARA